MKTPLTALALALSVLTGSLIAAAAEDAQRGASFQGRLYERYCAKLREGAQPYVLFVQRLKPIHGYTYYDFAPEYPGAPVKADCRASPERIAELHQQLRLAATAEAGAGAGQ